MHLSTYFAYYVDSALQDGGSACFIRCTVRRTPERILREKGLRVMLEHYE